MTDDVVVNMDNGKINIEGSLTFSTVSTLVPLAKSWLESGDDVVEVSLSGVSHADSAGLALLLEWWSVIQDKKRQLRYTDVPGQVARFIRNNGLESTLLS